MTEGRQRHRYQPVPRPWYRTTWFASLIVIAVVLAIAVVVAIPVWATATPQYCSSCKATRPEGQSWARSVHSGVSCTECHVPTGIAPALLLQRPHLKPESFPLDKVIITGSLPAEHYKAERPLEYARRVREGVSAVSMNAFIIWSITD